MRKREGDVDPSDWFNFHDALVDRFEVDFLAGTALLVLHAHDNWPNLPRTRLEIAFTGVSNVTTSADLAALRDNASAGNVNHAHFADEPGPGTSYVYLVQGYVAITADQPPKIEPVPLV